LVWQRLCRSEEWEFGVALPWWGWRAGLEDQRSHGLQSRGSMGLWGMAWHAAPAILLVYRDMECLPWARGSECWCFSSPWVSLVSQQNPWITELRRSSAVSQLQSWISSTRNILINVAAVYEKGPTGGSWWGRCFDSQWAEKLKRFGVGIG
jgi:hypothetical protein